ncbi:MAG TPA: hypothetical protein VIK78_02715 [Ruminiclostridium sp.]
MTSKRDNDTPAQPQTSQWEQLGENLGGVKFPWSRYATDRLMTSLYLGVSRTNEGVLKPLARLSSRNILYSCFHQPCNMALLILI